MLTKPCASLSPPRNCRARRCNGRSTIGTKPRRASSPGCAPSPRARTDPTRPMDELFYIVHLCGEKRDERAYAPLCRLIGEGEEAMRFSRRAPTYDVERHSHQRLRRRSAPLMRAIESPAGDEFARASRSKRSAISRARRNVLSDDEMRAYLKRLRREMKPRGELLRLDRLGGDGRQSRLRRFASRRRNFDQGPLHRRRRIQPWPTSTNR